MTFHDFLEAVAAADTYHVLGALLVGATVFFSIYSLGKRHGRKLAEQRRTLQVLNEVRNLPTVVQQREGAAQERREITDEAMRSIRILQEQFHQTVSQAIGNIEAAAQRSIRLVDSASQRRVKSKDAPKLCRHCGLNMGFYTSNKVAASSCTHSFPVDTLIREAMQKQGEVEAVRTLDETLAELRAVMRALQGLSDDGQGTELSSYWSRLRARAEEKKEENKK